MLSIATFNVKDLFAVSDAAAQTIISRKIETIAREIDRSGADVVGLQEVGSPELVEHVVSKLRSKSEWHAPIFGTPDARGIRCGIISRRKVVHQQVHEEADLSFPIFCDGDAPPFPGRLPLRRGVVHARIDGGAIGLVDVLVVHFKSKHKTPLVDRLGNKVPLDSGYERGEGRLRALVLRSAEALFVRRIVDDLTRDKARCVAVIGDFNDTRDSLPVDIVRGSWPFDLFDCTTNAPAEKRHTILFGGEREQIDQVLASRPLCDHLVACDIQNEALREHPVAIAPEGSPPFLTEDSDHALVVCRFDD